MDEIKDIPMQWHFHRHHLSIWKCKNIQFIRTSGIWRQFHKRYAGGKYFLWFALFNDWNKKNDRRNLSARLWYPLRWGHTHISTWQFCTKKGGFPHHKSWKHSLCSDTSWLVSRRMQKQFPAKTACIPRITITTAKQHFNHVFRFCRFALPRYKKQTAANPFGLFIFQAKIFQTKIIPSQSILHKRSDTAICQKKCPAIFVRYASWQTYQKR